jgi:predicted nucleic acid-binding protein
MAADRAFLDTNVLVYAFSLNDPRKPVAERLIIRGGVVGVQTLNEFVSVERNKLKAPWSEILDWLQIIEKLCPPPVPLTMAAHTRSLQIAQSTGYHIYDSLMLASAIEGQCTVFYSEDLHGEQEIEGLKIRNPFR